MPQDMRIEVGTIIWRGISGHVDGSYLDKFECHQTDRGSYMFKADSGRGHFTDQLVAFSGTCRFGLTCFVGTPPRDPWTHFVVVRLNKSGKSVVVRAVYGDPEELFKQYKGIGNCRHLLPQFTTLADTRPSV